MITSTEKTQYFSKEKITVAGSPEKPETYIYQLGEDGIMFRHAEIDSGLGGEPIEILQSTDFHLNCLNARDCIEQRPCIKSTREFRLAFRDGSTVPNTVRTMDITKFFDQTVITGDTIDYLTWGTLDLMDELVWNACPDVIVTMGGHDITRVMQGKVADETTLESRYDILKKFWRHDVNYFSKVLGDKVRIVCLNNGENKYLPGQAEMLEADIKDARERGIIVIIFQHEYLCTRNPAEEYVEPIRINDGSGSRDFLHGFLGNEEYCKNPDTAAVYDVITQNADVVKGVFCGHKHSDFYTEIIASYTDKDGNKVDTVIPQYVLTGNMYDKGHALIITIK
ncbi:MAG: metallophosphoesterase [Clostridia bacterium]|nr:metallophosphoesterase [Clostridia bacterium]